MGILGAAGTMLLLAGGLAGKGGTVGVVALMLVGARGPMFQGNAELGEGWGLCSDSLMHTGVIVTVVVTVAGVVAMLIVELAAAL